MGNYFNKKSCLFCHFSGYIASNIEKEDNGGK